MEDRIVNILKLAMIKEVQVEGKKRYRVFNEKGDRSFGTYNTKEEAKERLAQMEMFKSIAKRKKKK